ncbi:MAG: hypothetical protein JO047_07705 [Alphaproteobacteria bacterium]|nr:hypothetical protein [Alphaproteobacteria bacterium]
MDQIRTKIIVGPDHRITGTVPDDVAPGEHEVTITLPAPAGRERPHESLTVADLPTHDLGPWPQGLSLRREHLYGDDGR